MLCSPAICTITDLENGTYSINDLSDFHEILDFKDELKRRHKQQTGQGLKQWPY